MKKLIARWTECFVLWVFLFSSIAYLLPQAFTPLKPEIVPRLSMIMFGMGMTLLPDNFRRMLQMKRAVLCGILGQFILMPILAFIIAKGFKLNDELAMGFIILGACPGGTASNVIAYLDKAESHCL